MPAFCGFIYSIRILILKSFPSEFKSDIRAAREKNGVYIPHERFLQDEAEKKVHKSLSGASHPGNLFCFSQVHCQNCYNAMEFSLGEQLLSVTFIKKFRPYITFSLNKP